MTATQDSSPTKTVDKYSKSSNMRRQPIIHPSSDAPLCKSCHQLDLPFFDPSCPGCMEILQSPDTTVPQIFAIIRQWMPQTQQNIEILVNEVSSCTYCAIINDLRIRILCIKIKNKLF